MIRMSVATVPVVAHDDIGRLDIISLPRLCRKWYAEIVAITGTGTAVNVDLIFSAVVP